MIWLTLLFILYDGFCNAQEIDNSCNDSANEMVNCTNDTNSMYCPMHLVIPSALDNTLIWRCTFWIIRHYWTNLQKRFILLKELSLSLLRSLTTFKQIMTRNLKMIALQIVPCSRVHIFGVKMTSIFLAQE